MKTTLCLLILLSSCSTSLVNAYIPADFYEEIPSNRVFNVIQNEFSKRITATFSKLSEKERQKLYNEALNILYGSNLNAYQSFTKGIIHNAVDVVLTQQAGRYMENLARNYVAENVITPEEACNYYKEKITLECHQKPTENIFDTYFNERTIYQHLKEFDKTKRETHYSSYGRPATSHKIFLESFYDFLEILFPHYHTHDQILTPESNNRPNPTQTQSPNSDAIFDAPLSHTPHHIYPVGECCCGDAEAFSKTNESFFLSCGHNVCKNIINDWIMINGSCPMCRATINNQEKYDLQNALKTVAVCALCNQKDIPLSTLSWCDHYLCEPCKKVWTAKKDGYPSSCPRCFTIR